MALTNGVIGSVILVLTLSRGLGPAVPSEKSITLPPDNPVSELKPGAGADKTRASCIACHSTDYIVRQPGRDAKQWEAEVQKMITVFGAPVREDDAKAIVEYLARYYGPAAKSPSKMTAPANPR